MSSYTDIYFENNFNRLLGLVSSAYANKDLDKILETKRVQVIINTGLKLKGSTSLSNLENCQKTINKHFGGLHNIRCSPMWKLHIDVALAIFNNRLQNDTMARTFVSPYKNPFAVILESFEYANPTFFDLAGLEKIYNSELMRKNNQTGIEDYKIACCFLCRIPTLDDEEVKQLVAFILRWMIKKYNKDKKEDKHDLIMTIFDSYYDKHLRDLGPENKMLEDIHSTDVMKIMYRMWPKIDMDMPVLKKDVESHSLSPSKQKEGSPSSQSTYRSGRGRPRRRHSSSSDDEQELYTPLNSSRSSSYLDDEEEVLSRQAGRSRKNRRRRLSSSDNEEEKVPVRKRFRRPVSRAVRRSSRSSTNAPSSSPSTTKSQTRSLSSFSFSQSQVICSTPSTTNLHSKTDNASAEVSSLATESIPTTRAYSSTKADTERKNRVLDEKSAALRKEIDKLKAERKELIDKEKFITEKESRIDQMMKKVDEMQNLIDKRNRILQEESKKIKVEQEKLIEREKAVTARQNTVEERIKKVTESEIRQNTREQVQNEREVVQNKRQEELNDLSIKLIELKKNMDEEKSVYVTDEESLLSEQEENKENLDRLTETATKEKSFKENENVLYGSNEDDLAEKKDMDEEASVYVTDTESLHTEQEESEDDLDLLSKATTEEKSSKEDENVLYSSDEDDLGEKKSLRSMLLWWKE